MGGDLYRVLERIDGRVCRFRGRATGTPPEGVAHDGTAHGIVFLDE